ncbi:Transcriptional regulator of nonfermentable carbon utilization [Lecanora helva]
MTSRIQGDDAPSRSHSESSDDSDSQDSDEMRGKEVAGPRKTADGKVKKPANKDPNRVKRKKARRACENCQRAHLTCSDQRPCERCGDKKPCRDGKRKKAKYLEGTEDKDLIPGQEKEQEEQERARVMNRFPSGLLSGPGLPFARPGGGYQLANQQPAPPGFPMFTSNVPPMPMSSQPYSSQMMSTAQQSRAMNYGQQRPFMDDYNATLNSAAQVPPGQMRNTFADSYPELDLEQMGFDNRFGALEFNMLNEMSSGLVDTPTSDSVGGYEHSDSINYGMMPAEYGSSPASAQQWRFPQPGSSQGAIAYNLGGQERDPFDGFVKQEDRPGGLPQGSLQGQSSYPSPISGPSGPSPQGMMAGFEGNPATQEMITNNNSSAQAQGLLKATQAPQQPPDSVTSVSAIPATIPSTTPAPTLLAPNTYSRRSRNPSTVYNMVTEPYSYTKAFHDLMALIRKRFSQQRTAHIARALASIRPSFISSLTKLDDSDRVFMEKCLQRTLLEYEDNICLTGTPTILCRRTGEVVAVGEGFSILTGWRKGVLLGKEPNLNVNDGKNDDGNVSSDTGVSAGTDGFSSDDTRLKPVSIVELLDDESVCDFFDDYAHLAFGDSRGSVTTPCKLLKYKAAAEKSFEKKLDNESESGSKKQRNDTQPRREGEEDDKVECMLCWSVKRDVFDIPMLFVINVLPCI